MRRLEYNAHLYFCMPWWEGPPCLERADVVHGYSRRAHPPPTAVVNDFVHQRQAFHLPVPMARDKRAHQDWFEVHSWCLPPWRYKHPVTCARPLKNLDLTYHPSTTAGCTSRDTLLHIVAACITSFAMLAPRARRKRDHVGGEYRHQSDTGVFVRKQIFTRFPTF